MPRYFIVMVLLIFIVAISACAHKNNDLINAADSALINAAAKGDIQTVKTLLASGADVNAKGNNGETALMMSSGKGYIGVVKVLLASGADVNAKDNKGWTALHIASLVDNEEIVKLLKKANAK